MKKNKPIVTRDLFLMKTPMRDKIFLYYVIGAYIIVLLSGFNFLVAGIVIILYSFFMSTYIAWLVSGCEKCKSININIYANFYSAISSLTILILMVWGTIQEYYNSSDADLAWVLMFAVGPAFILYFIYAPFFTYDVERFIKYRNRKKKE